MWTFRYRGGPFVDTQKQPGSEHVSARQEWSIGTAWTSYKPQAVHLRKLFRKHQFNAVEGVDDNYVLFPRRLQECERHINDNDSVGKLCQDAVERLETLRDKQGARMTF